MIFNNDVPFFLAFDFNTINSPTFRLNFIEWVDGMADNVKLIRFSY